VGGGRWEVGAAAGMGRVVPVADGASRACVGRPAADQVCAALDLAARRAGRAPKYTVTDHGAQLGGALRGWCARNGVKPGFRAVGRYGSIADASDRDCGLGGFGSFRAGPQHPRSRWSSLIPSLQSSTWRPFPPAGRRARSAEVHPGDEGATSEKRRAADEACDVAVGALCRHRGANGFRCSCAGPKGLLLAFRSAHARWTTTPEPDLGYALIR
jgi:hypothetical protein